MNTLLAFFGGITLGIFLGIAGFFAYTQEDKHDYLNHDQNDEFSDQL